MKRNQQGQMSYCPHHLNNNNWKIENLFNLNVSGLKNDI